jgi:pantoate--beta-alanine ligase
MRVVKTVAELREAVAAWRRCGERVAFVPTMGNLHAGHYSLLQRARAQCERVVASVFVNPTQFGPNEDFARYPRTPEQDRAGLLAAQCDLLFEPSVEQMYPYGTAAAVGVHVPVITRELDGAARPGHFDGVATVVLRLLNMVQPDVAVFGRKDLQQLMVVRRLVADLALPVQIDAAPTQREADGLAMSSRNQYLDPAQRETAPLLHRQLQSMRGAALDGGDLGRIESDAAAALATAGFKVDYIEFRRAEDLARVAASTRSDLVILAAARLGTTRLIDNIDV